MISPLQGSKDFRTFHPGLAPWAVLFRPVGAPERPFSSGQPMNWRWALDEAVAGRFPTDITLIPRFSSTPGDQWEISVLWEARRFESTGDLRCRVFSICVNLRQSADPIQQNEEGYPQIITDFRRLGRCPSGVPSEVIRTTAAHQEVRQCHFDSEVYFNPVNPMGDQRTGGSACVRMNRRHPLPCILNLC